MADFCRNINKKHLKYKIKSFDVTGKSAVVKIGCRYKDTYDAAKASFDDVVNYMYSNPNATSEQIDQYQYKRMIKWDKKYGKTYADVTLTFQFKKVNNKWKIVSYTKAMNNMLHGNYQMAFDDYF